MFCEIWLQWSIAGVLAGASGPIGVPLMSYMYESAVLLNWTVLLNFGRSEAIDVSAPNSIEITANAPNAASTNSRRSLRPAGAGVSARDGA